MTPIQIIFLITATVTLGAALMVVTTRNMIHAALWLILSLFGIAVFFVLLNAGFLAVAQVVIYIGAIAILMIFAIMMTRNIADFSESQTNQNWPWALLIVVVLFAGLASILYFWPGISSLTSPISPDTDPISQLGQALVAPNAYLIPFEVASVLLLAALIGAIYIAWDRNGGQEEL
jgi:NADH-quinone oxidoreductase subunit J